MLLLAVFAGPRPNTDALVSDFASARMPAAVDKATRFHKLEEPKVLKVDGGVVLGDDGRPVSLPGKLDGDEPVYETQRGEELVEVLCKDLTAAQDIAGRHGFRLRMHGPSGFSSVRQAEQVAG